MSQAGRVFRLASCLSSGQGHRPPGYSPDRRGTLPAMDCETYLTHIRSDSTLVSGGAVSMDLWLWGRGPIEDLTVDGDPVLVELLRQAAKEETQ